MSTGSDLSGLQSLQPTFTPVEVSVAFAGSVETALGYLKTLQVSGEGFDALLDGHQQVLHEALYTHFVGLVGTTANAPMSQQSGTYSSDLYRVVVETSATERDCTVYNQQNEPVFSATDVAFDDNNPNSGFWVHTCTLDTLTICEASEAYLSKPDTRKTGMESVVSELKRLGHFAPEGSRALVVAESVLRSDGSDVRTLGPYVFARTEEGGLSLKDTSTQRELVSMSPQGKVSPATLSAADKQLFNGMYKQLHRVALEQKVKPDPALAKLPLADFYR